MEEQTFSEPPLFSALSRIERITTDHVFYIKPKELEPWRGPLILQRGRMIHLRTGEEVPGPIWRLVHLPLLPKNESPPIAHTPGLPAWVRNQENIADPVYLLELDREVAENPTTQLQRLFAPQWENAKQAMFEQTGKKLRALRVYPGGMIRAFVEED